jgi:hypothetical protein
MWVLAVASPAARVRSMRLGRSAARPGAGLRSAAPWPPVPSGAGTPAGSVVPAAGCYALLAGYAIGVPCLGAWLLRRRDA